MKSVLIDPHLRTITPVEYDGTLDAAYKLIGCELVEPVYLNDKGDCLYLDEEGLLGNLAEQAFFRLTVDGNTTDLAGRALLVGTDDEGNTVESKLTTADIIPLVQWLVLTSKRTVEVV